MAGPTDSTYRHHSTPLEPLVALAVLAWHSPSMNTAIVEPAFAELLREIQARKAKNPPVAKATWMEIIGTSKGDDLDREAARLGEEWRRGEQLRE